MLGDLENLLDRYNSLPPQSRMTWDRTNWQQEAGKALRARLSTNISIISTFYEDLVHSPQIRIENALAHLMADFQGGHKDASSVVSLATGSDADEDAAWPQLARDLEALGISQSEATEYRGYILDWFIKAINEGSNRDRNPGLEYDATLQSPSMDARTNAAEVLIDDSMRREVMPPNSNAHTFSYAPTQEPASYQHDESNLIRMAQMTVVHWNQTQWSQAKQYLQHQLYSVEAGHINSGSVLQYKPDARILRHLLGICASFAGEFQRAKTIFESIHQGPYVMGLKLDDGDIAAARWLGDACLQLDEAANAALAWAVALNGLVAMYGSDSTQVHSVLYELKILDFFTKGLSSLSVSFSRFNVDASTIFSTTSSIDKSKLVGAALELASRGVGLAMGIGPWRRPSINLRILEACLVSPSMSLVSWPIQHDPFLDITNASRLAGEFGSLTSAFTKDRSGINYKDIPTTALGQSGKLDYATKMDPKLLVKTLEAGLSAHDIEYREQPSQILCRLSQFENQMAFSECVAIKIRKLPLRSTHGVKVSHGFHRTRSIRGNWYAEFLQQKKTLAELSKLVKTILSEAERGAPQLPELPTPAVPPGFSELHSNHTIELPSVGCEVLPPGQAELP